MTVELTWEGKYDENGNRRSPLRVNLPFQTIETINESFQERQRNLLAPAGSDWRNRLIWGDKKYVLPSLLPEFAGKVNLIYIDPPFDTGANFSFQVEVEGEQFTKEPSIIEQKAYRDTWGKGLDSYLDQFYKSGSILHDLLADDGAIYVHLDWRLVHYVKVAMDEIFGYENFMANIIWKRIASGRKAKSYKWLAVDDIILVYTKGSHSIRQQYTPYTEEYKKRFVHEDEEGKYFWDNIGSYSEERLKRLEEMGRVKYPENPNAKPRIKNYLHEGKGVIIDNIWTDISPVNSQASEDTGYPTQKPGPLLERIVTASSDEGDLVLDCFCGSGTTVAVAEKLNRKWITCDLGRFAIHTARKRLLSIPDVQPFVVQNLGKYERQAWQKDEFGEDAIQRIDAYNSFILELYHAQKINGFTWLHGIKNKRLVHIGGIEAPVTLGDVKAIIIEWRKNLQKAESSGIDVLGWEFSFEINEIARQQAQEAGVDMRFLQIPREVLEKKAVEQGDIQFFELAALFVETKVKKKSLTVELTNFIAPIDYVPQEIREKITDWKAWIDYWAIDFDFKGDTFHNQWQSYRTRKDKKLETSRTHTYDGPGKYQVQVKVIDILGNDSTKTIEIEIKG